MFNGQNHSVGQTRRVVTRRRQMVYLSTVLNSRVLHLSSHYILVSKFLFVHKHVTELFLVWWTMQRPLNFFTVWRTLRLYIYSSLTETRTSLNVGLNGWHAGNSNSLFLHNVIQSSTPFNVRIPNSCYVSILFCRFLTFMRSHHNMKAVRRDCSLL